MAAGVQIVASFFLLIPIRDEMSVQLGTSRLPALFGTSLLVSMLGQPVTSWVITSSSDSLTSGIRRFFNIVAYVLTGFAVLVLLSHDPSGTVLHAPGGKAALPLPAPGHVQQATGVQQHMYSMVARSSTLKKVLSRLALYQEDEPNTGAEDVQFGRSLLRVAHMSQPQQQLPPVPPVPIEAYHGTGGGTFTVSGGEKTLSLARRSLFVAFYLWMSTQNLMSASVLWARCADVFPGDAAQRVFGVLAAAATAGQLAGSSSVAFFCRKCGKNFPAGAPQCLRFCLSTSMCCVLDASHRQADGLRSG
jgi:hypothetical protein